MLRQLVHFGEQRPRVGHDAVADDAQDARMQDAGRNQAQDELGAAHIHGVSRVVTTLIARDDVEMWCEEIDDLAFSFVAPLRSEHG